MVVGEQAKSDENAHRDRERRSARRQLADRAMLHPAHEQPVDQQQADRRNSLGHDGEVSRFRVAICGIVTAGKICVPA